MFIIEKYHKNTNKILNKDNLKEKIYVKRRLLNRKHTHLKKLNL